MPGDGYAEAQEKGRRMVRRPNLRNRSTPMAWKTPKITVISVGMEINCYACAEL
jgi:coenzyme PQQ precursor peptide PqqA